MEVLQKPAMDRARMIAPRAEQEDGLNRTRQTVYDRVWSDNDLIVAQVSMKLLTKHAGKLVRRPGALPVMPCVAALSASVSQFHGASVACIRASDRHRWRVDEAAVAVEHL